MLMIPSDKLKAYLAKLQDGFNQQPAFKENKDSDAVQSVEYLFSLVEDKIKLLEFEVDLSAAAVGGRLVGEVEQHIGGQVILYKPKNERAKQMCGDGMDEPEFAEGGDG